LGSGAASGGAIEIGGVEEELAVIGGLLVIAGVENSRIEA
jgi:hypothetical protein